jgi:hypothetical protein
VKPDELNEYTAMYKLEPDKTKNVRIISLESQALYYLTPEGNWFLYFKTDKDKFLHQGGISLIFERDNNNKIKGFTGYFNQRLVIQEKLLEQASRE